MNTTVFDIHGQALHMTRFPEAAYNFLGKSHVNSFTSRWRYSTYPGKTRANRKKPFGKFPLAIFLRMVYTEQSKCTCRCDGIGRRSVLKIHRCEPERRQWRRKRGCSKCSGRRGTQAFAPRTFAGDRKRRRHHAAGRRPQNKIASGGWWLTNLDAPAGVMELVDVVDSKSTAGDSVPVRVRSPAPKKKREAKASLFFFAVGVPTDSNEVRVWGATRPPPVAEPREGSEWPRSVCNEAPPWARRTPGTATGHRHQ